MNLVMINLEIKSVEGGNRIAGRTANSRYLRYGLKDPLHPQIGYGAQTSFNEDVIKTYAAVLPKKRGGELPDDEAWTEENIPMSLRTFSGAVEVTYDLGGKYCMLYTNDIVDENGKVIPGKKAGDVICGRNGLPKIYETVSIMCAQSYELEDLFDENTWEPIIDPRTGMQKQRPVRDKDGNFKKTWTKNYTPEDIGEARKALMIPYDEVVRRGLITVAAADEVDVEIEDLAE